MRLDDDDCVEHGWEPAELQTIVVMRALPHRVPVGPAALRYGGITYREPHSAHRRLLSTC